MDQEIIHITPNKIKLNLSVLLLFLPAIVFVTVLIFLTMRISSHQAASTTTTDVLGGQDQNLK